MPKVVKMDPLEERRRRIRGTIAKGMTLYEYDNTDMSQILGCSLSTFKKRKRYPEEFTLQQLWTLAKVLHFTMDEVEEFI